MEENFIKSKFVSVDKSDTVSRLIGQLKLHNEKSALVFDGKKFVGVAETHHLLRTKLDPAGMKVAKIVKKVHILDGNEDLKEIVRVMFASETRILPVVQNDKVIGVVNAKDILLELRGSDDAKKKISEVMTLDPITIKEDGSIGSVISLMKENRVSKIPVVDDDGNLLNIISFTDILFDYILMLQSKSESRGRGTFTMSGPRTIRAFRQKVDLNKFPVVNFSSSLMITASSGDIISRIIDKMERFDISSLVIVDGKKPVGIVTIRDLLRLFLKDKITL